MPGPYVSSSAKNYVGFGKQTVKGTGVAPTVFLPYMGAVDLNHGMSAQEVREAGIGPYVSRHVKTKHDPDGGASAAWRPSTMAKLAAWFLGADALGAEIAAPYTHTATPAETVVYLAVEQNLADEFVERFVDAAINGFSISGEGGGDLMLALTWLAMSPAWQAGAATETYETGVSGVSPGGPYRQNEAAYTIDGAAATDVQNWKLDLAWKVDDDIRLSSITRAHIVKLELTGRITLKQLLMAVSTYRTVNYGSAAGSAADRNFNAGSFVAAYDNGLATTNKRTLNINAPNIDWTSDKYTALNPDGETAYNEREGTLKKVAGTSFVTITSGTADAAAY